MKLPVSLPPYGSCFIVFNNKSSAAPFKAVKPLGQHPPLINYTRNGLQFLQEGLIELESSTGTERIENKRDEQVLEGTWKITFPKGWGAPDSLTFPNLISWTEANDKGVQYFSGTATYHKTFEFTRHASTQNNSIYLELGDLSKVAEVWLNDKRLGITWTKPYNFNVTDVLKPGTNNLRIEISNTWSNRLTGDALTGEKYTLTNITKANKNSVPWGELPLIKSGLLGPIKITVVKTILVRKH